MPDPEPILSFDLPNRRGKRSFDTIDEFEKWIQIQTMWWNKLGGTQGQNNDSFSYWRQFITTVNQQLPQIKVTGQGQGQRDQAVSAIRQALNQYYSQQLPESESPEGLIISDYLERDPNLAYGFLAAIAVPNINLQNRPAGLWGGFMLGNLHRVGMLKESKVDQDYLASVEKDWRDRLGKLHSEISAANGESQSFLQDIRKECEAQREESERQLRQFEEIKAKFANDFEEMRRQYDTKLALSAPVKYWRNKEQEHKKSARAWGVATLLITVLSAIAMGLELYNVFHLSTPLDYPHLALIVLVAAFVFFILRLLARMFLSGVHLQSDAAQRATMTEVYIALESEGRMKADLDRAFILEAMFRPVTMGVVKEEITPPHPIEAIISKLSNDKP